METVVQSPVDSPAELHLLTDWERDSSRFREAGSLSVLIHVLAIATLVLMPRSFVKQSRQDTTHFTPLIEPPTTLTQKAPNKGKISKEITAEALIPRPRIQIPPSPPSTTRPPARKNTPAQAPPPAPLPEPPRIDAGLKGGQPPTGLPEGPQMAQATPPPQIQPEEKPKLALETPTAPPPSGGRGKIAIPDTSVAGAIRSIARGASQAGMTIGDDTGDPGPGGLGGGINLPPSPGRTASALQLLSDPMGVDFRPYLIQVLASVRRNWVAVFPESAKQGRRGKVQIQFAIGRDGSVPKLVIVMPSGAEALDRAAVAGISASNPFPPLPTQFSGNMIRLQFTFLYNIPRN
jgi:TonB family protein